MASATELDPGPPPSGAEEASELAELKAWEARRSEADAQAIAYWEQLPPPLRWSAIARDQILPAHFGGPRSARAFALVHVAIHDATVAVWAAKAKHQRSAPYLRQGGLPLAGDPSLPSYPSEHAAIAEAAAGVLAALRPEQAERLRLQAQGAGESRIAGGANWPSDVAAGRRMGQAVATQVLARAAQDGSERLAQLPLVVPAGAWNTDYPVDAIAGTWRPWLAPSASAWAISPTPARDAASLKPELDALEANLAASAPPELAARLAAWEWSDPARQWNDWARALPKMASRNSPQLARALASLHVGLADLHLAVWEDSYRVLRPYPATLRPGLPPRRPAPLFPAHPALMPACAQLAAEVLPPLLPDLAQADFQASAQAAREAAAASGLYLSSDAADGLRLAEGVAATLRAHLQP